MTGLTARRGEFAVWRPRVPFVMAARGVIDEARNDPWAARHQWIRDLWLACAFSERVRARRVRLVPLDMQRPDFQVELQNRHVMRIEATEVDMPGRRRHDEYRAWIAAGQPTLHETFEELAIKRAAIPGAVEDAARKKASKNYPAGTSLFLYVNLATYDMWIPEVERELVTCTAPAREKFRSVWVLWNGDLYRCWPNPIAYHGAGRHRRL